ncbi:MAG: TolC family outer membrane protein [Methylocystis sp.]|nr:TolC family outer membrane protein [Methylocystis sp.]MCA3584362.1 TolC family outer membrane protein [Methylocystis sp.]MCA3589742.1 TolC family outer membrane protein [Methylocystis sp.]MCA3592617.1 TolC family outer membrane protein [Methylocystis sp.]
MTAIIREAVGANPEVGASRANRRAVDQELEAAKGLSRPTVDLSAQTGVRSGDIIDSRIGQEYRRVGRDRVNGSVIVSQNLFDGNEAKSEQRRQGERVNSARSRVADAANSIALRTAQAYLEVQRSAAVVDVAQRNVAVHNEILTRVRARSDGGGGSPVDVNVASARIEAARAFLAEAQGRNRDAETLYRAVVGKKPGKLQPVQAPVKALPRTVDIAVSEAVQIAPSVLAALADTRAAEASIDSAQSRFYPRIDAQLFADGNYGLFYRDRSRYDASALLVLRHNLYRGGIDTARVAEARERTTEARDAAENARRVVEREVRFAWSAIQSAQARGAALARQIEQNRLAFGGYVQQYELGQRTLIDILDIQNETFITQTNMVTEEFSGRYSVFRVLAGIGRLLPALGINPPEEALWPSGEPVRRPQGAL